MNEQNIDIPVALTIMMLCVITLLVAFLVVMRLETVKHRATYRKPPRELRAALRHLDRANELEDTAKKARLKAEALVEKTVANNRSIEKNEVFV